MTAVVGDRIRIITFQGATVAGGYGTVTEVLTDGVHYRGADRDNFTGDHWYAHNTCYVVDNPESTAVLDAELDALLSEDDTEENHDVVTFAGDVIATQPPTVEPYRPRATTDAQVGDRIRITLDTGGSAVGTEHTVTRVIPMDTTSWDDPGVMYVESPNGFDWHASFESFEFVNVEPATPSQLKLLVAEKRDAYAAAPDTLAKKVVVEELNWVLTLLG